MTYYKADITMTSKDIGPRKDPFRVFNHDVKTFESLESLKQWLHNTYGTHKRGVMKREKSDGSFIKVGYVFHYVNCDFSHAPLEKWYQQDWIELSHVYEYPILQ